MNAVFDEDKDSKPLSKTRNIAVNNDRIDSRNIFVGTREIMISHGDDVYRLRLTAQNKLILTK
jgi:hemin uptake protein HemP